jgi:hypothetical protein
MTEYYRQFAFVGSVLAGFAFAFYGTLLLAPTPHRTASWAAFLSVTASIAFLLVTLGTTFAASRAATLQAGAAMPPEITSQVPIISMLFLVGVLFLLTSFGLGGWVRSRSLGIATTTCAAIGAIGVFVVMSPFLHTVNS